MMNEILRSPPSTSIQTAMKYPCAGGGGGYSSPTSVMTFPPPPPQEDKPQQQQIPQRRQRVVDNQPIKTATINEDTTTRIASYGDTNRDNDEHGKRLVALIQTLSIRAALTLTGKEQVGGN